MTFIDLFAGTGFIRKGLEEAGHKCIGWCEIDKYAQQSYRAIHNTEGEWFIDDINKIEPGTIPYADCWCFGFPCQDISMAGKQSGLIGHRSGLFYKVCSIIQSQKDKDKPKYLLIENVKNLLSINDGWDFTKVLSELDELGYDIQWQVLNSKNFGVPQNRERVFLIGHLRTESRPKVFPLTRADKKNSQLEVISKPIVPTITARGAGEYHAGMQLVVSLTRTRTDEAKKIRHDNMKNGRDYTPWSCRQLEPRKDGLMNCLTTSISKDHLLFDGLKIRRLTPLECFRLQGCPDELFYKAKKSGLTDRQLYKIAGNAVTIPVIKYIGLSLP